jgi:hypothetical protein
MELDDTDAAYPTASRGVIVRHIRVKGFANRSGYSEPAIDTQLDDTPTPREMTFIACKRTPAHTTTPTVLSDVKQCGFYSDDQVLTRARVRFVPISGTDSTPTVTWWEWCKARQTDTTKPADVCVG